MKSCQRDTLATKVSESQGGRTGPPAVPATPAQESGSQEQASDGKSASGVGGGGPGPFGSALRGGCLSHPDTAGKSAVISMARVDSEQPENDKWSPQSEGCFPLLAFSLLCSQFPFSTCEL